MRDAVDAFLDRGGNVARFAGNYIWQIRYEDDGATQVCFKSPAQDPYSTSDKSHLTTTLWEHPIIGRPAAETMGLTGAAGIYARVGGASPRGSGGFTVYRPRHWAFAGTDLYYGDIIGREAVIVAFEVDGLDYTFRDGLPYPTHKDGAPETIEILALTPAIKGEEDHTSGARSPLAKMEEFEHMNNDLDTYLTDDIAPKGTGLRSPYGSAMIAVYHRGRGTVFNAGTTLWVNGLLKGDYFVEQITRNVMDRLSNKQN